MEDSQADEQIHDDDDVINAVNMADEVKNPKEWGTLLNDSTKHMESGVAKESCSEISVSAAVNDKS